MLVISSLLSTMKQHLIRALKTFLVIHGLKVNTHDLGQGLGGGHYFGSLIISRELVDPELWMHGLFIPCKSEVSL